MNKEEPIFEEIKDGLTTRIIANMENMTITKIGKAKLAGFLVNNNQQIIKVFKEAKSVDLQISLLKIIHQVLTKQQIINGKYFCEQIERVALTKRLNKVQIRKYLLEYNNENKTKIIGCQIKSLISSLKGVNLIDGILFLNEEDMRIYGKGHSIIIFYKSILTIENKNETNIVVNAYENKRVELELVEDGAHSNVINRLNVLFGNHLETEDSITLSVEEYRNEDLIFKENKLREITNGVPITEIIKNTNDDNHINKDKTYKPTIKPKTYSTVVKDTPDNSYIHLSLNDKKDVLDNAKYNCTKEKYLNNKRVTFRLEDNTEYKLAELPIKNKDKTNISTQSSNSLSVDNNSLSVDNNSLNVDNNNFKKETNKKIYKTTMNLKKTAGKKWLGKEFKQKIKTIYKRQLNYNKQLYKEMNNKAKVFKEAMLNIGKSNSYIAPNKL